MALSIFVSEYICGGALVGDELPPSLAAEGGAMLAAVVEDLAALPDVEVVTTLDRRLHRASERKAISNQPSAVSKEYLRADHCKLTAFGSLAHSLTRSLARHAHVVEVSDSAGEITHFRRLARQCDATLVIAPEFDRILYKRSRGVEESGRRLLGSSSDAVAITSDKYWTNRLLAEHGVPATHGVAFRLPVSNEARERVSELASWRVNELASWISSEPPNPRPQTPDPKPQTSFPAVLKPRFGAGSQCTYLIERASDVSGILEQAVREGIGEHAVLEAYVPGQPASVAVLIGETGAVPLPVASQILSSDGRFHYLGGSVPLDVKWATRSASRVFRSRSERTTVIEGHARLAQEAALRAVACVPGLRGYVGVDLVLGGEGRPVTIVEINPRLTTSYVALRHVVQQNLMALIVGDETGTSQLDLTGNRIAFTPDGRWASERVSG